MPNLLQVYNARITEDTSASLKGFEAINLTRNLAARTCNDEYSPLLDQWGTRGFYNSCFKTTESQLWLTGHHLTLGIDLGTSVTVHAILLVEEVTSNSNNLMQNYEIYIGDDADFRKNQKCEGGPFMQTGDPNDVS